jgi:L-ribulose-5-phosphate 4-epimerase
LRGSEIEEAYEANTGHAIVRRFQGMDPLEMPAVLVAGHAPFTWGASAAEAAHNAVVLEEIAQTALQTLAVDPGAAPISQALLDKHFFRKHGAKAYYGQIKR